MKVNFKVVLILLICTTSLFPLNIKQEMPYQTETVSAQSNSMIKPLQENNYCEDFINYSRISRVYPELSSYYSYENCIDGNFAYITRGSVFIFNITDPASPVLINKYRYQWGSVLKAKVKNGLGYLACDNLGVVVVNFTDPLNPVELGKCGRFDGMVRTNSNEKIEDCFFDENYAYIIVRGYHGTTFGWDNFMALYIIDLSDPIFLKPIGYYFDRGNFGKVIVSNGYCYLSRRTFSKGEYIIILDVSNPAKPRKVADISDISFGDYLYVSNDVAIIEERNGIYSIYDVSNPRNPKEKSQISSFHSGNFYILNDKLFFTSNFTLTIYDISDLSLPTFVSNTSINYYTSGIFAVDNVLYLDFVDNNASLESFDITDLSNPSFLSETCYGVISGSGWPITINRDYVFIQSEFGIEVVNISDYLNPVRISTYDWRKDLITQGYGESLGYSETILIENITCYIVFRNAVAIVNCSDVTNFSLISVFLDESFTISTTCGLKDSFLYVLTYDNQIRIINATDPYNLSSFGICSVEGGFVELLFANENTIYIRYYDSSISAYRLKIIDVSDKTHPVSVGTIDGYLANYGSGVIAKDIAYFLYYRELVIIDISDPFNPINISSINITEYYSYNYMYRSLALCDNKAYVFSDTRIEVFDIGDSANPRKISEYLYPSEYYSEYGSENHGIYYSYERLEIGPIIVNNDKIFITRFELGFDILGSDMDCDSLADYLEYNVYNTNPYKFDTDSDGISDGFECFRGLDPFNESDATLDNDKDGLNNIIESYYGTNPFSEDSDQDGLTDTYEIDNQLDPNYFDTEKDGLSDGVEVLIFGTDPFRFDTDGDTKDDFYEVARGNNPLIWSSWKLVFIGYFFPVYCVLTCASPWIIIRTKKYAKNLKVKITEGFEENN